MYVKKRMIKPRKKSRNEMKFSKLVDDARSLSCHAYELVRALNAEFSNVKLTVPSFCKYIYTHLCI